MLKIEHLSKSYQKRIVVQDVSLLVHPGEIVGLLGPNGAGKTTCFYMIAGLIGSDSGEIWLGNEDITRYPMHLRAQKGLGYLPQEASIFQKLTVKENILAILELQKTLTTEARTARCNELLSEFHLQPIEYSLGISLSGGERRRVEIARALASNPQFILLDEPFAGIDPLSVIDLKKQIKELTQKGIGILITDHNVRETLGICHRAYILNNGCVLATGTPTQILENQQVRDVYLGDSFVL